MNVRNDFVRPISRRAPDEAIRLLTICRTTPRSHFTRLLMCYGALEEYIRHLLTAGYFKEAVG